MTIKLTVGLTKKVGQPDFGSLGASCNVELILDGATSPSGIDAIQDQARIAFAQCRDAVEQELNGSRSNSAPPKQMSTPSRSQANANPREANHPAPAATEKQIRALHAIANKHRLDLVGELVSRFGVQRADHLTVRQASELIDAIKPESVGAAR